jgi:hypothetical protein
MYRLSYKIILNVISLKKCIVKCVIAELDKKVN